MKRGAVFQCCRTFLTVFLIANAFGNVEARKDLGQPFDAASFALCKQYGCKFLNRTTWEGGPFGPGSRLEFQLERYDAKLGVDLRDPNFITGLWLKFLRYPLDANDEVLAESFVNAASGYSYKAGLVSRCLSESLKHLSESVIFSGQVMGAKCEVKSYRNAHLSSIFIFFAD